MIRSIAAPMDADKAVIRRNLTQEALVEAIHTSTPLWIDITEPTADELDWLQQVLDLHPLVIQDLKRVDTRPTMLAYTNYIFLSLFQPEMRLKQVTGHEIHCVIGEHNFITVRHNNSSAVDDAYDRASKNPNYWERDVVYFLYLTMQTVIDSYYPLMDQISNTLNQLEEHLLEDHAVNRIRRQVYRIKQQLISLRQMVAPQREVLSNVIGEERLTRNNEDRDLFRHLYERLMRVYDLIDSQRDLSSNVLDLIQSQESQRLGRAVNRLTIFSMLFLPLTFITGVFELNFISTTEALELPVSGLVLSLLIFLVMLAIVTTMIWYFRQQKWL
ncbi:MAG: magnesium transporter CorA family protein [Anaerolineae bacterium]